MRATGIVLRIDDLGHIVIPKGIKRILQIKGRNLLLTTLSIEHKYL